MNNNLQVKNLISYNDLSITILADHDEDRISDLIPGEYEGSIILLFNQHEVKA